jgi:hypothetical protein
MTDATKNGCLEVVKWLHFNRREGCSHLALTRAAEKGHVEVVKWLVENRSEASINTLISHGNPLILARHSDVAKQIISHQLK